jgi:hypothetical protein
MTREKGFMSIDTLAHIERTYLREAVPEYVTLNHFGEYFIHPSFDILTRFLSSRGYCTGVCSNGVAINVENIKRAANSGLNALWLQWNTFRSIDKLAVAAESSIDSIVVRFLFNEENEEELKGFIKDEYVISERFGDRVGIEYTRRHNFSTENRGFKFHGICDVYRSNLACVLWDGRMVNCCFDYDGVDIIQDDGSTTWNLCKGCSFRELKY